LTQEEWEQLARELAMSDEEFLEMAANLGKQPDQDLLAQNYQTDVIMSDEQDMDQAENSDDADDDNAGYEDDGQFRCDEPRCRYRTNRLSNLPRHKRTHLSKEEKQKFKGELYLASLINAHTLILPFQSLAPGKVASSLFTKTLM
jgi:hypothetical protein